MVVLDQDDGADEIKEATKPETEQQWELSCDWMNFSSVFLMGEDASC